MTLRKVAMWTRWRRAEEETEKKEEKKEENKEEKEDKWTEIDDLAAEFDDLGVSSKEYLVILADKRLHWDTQGRGRRPWTWLCITPANLKPAKRQPTLESRVQRDVVRDLEFIYSDKLISDYVVLEPVVVNLDGLQQVDERHSKVTVSIPSKCINEIVEESGRDLSTKLFRRSDQLCCIEVILPNTGALALVDKKGREWSVSLRKLKIDGVEQCKGKAAVRFEIVKKLFQRLGKLDKDLDTTLEKGQWVLHMKLESVSVTQIPKNRKKQAEQARCVVPAAQGSDAVDEYIKTMLM